MRLETRRRIISASDWLGQGLANKTLPDRAYWLRRGERVIDPDKFHRVLLDSLHVHDSIFNTANKQKFRYEPWYTGEMLKEFINRRAVQNVDRLKWLLETGKINKCYGPNFPLDIMSSASDNPVEEQEKAKTSTV